MRTDFAEQTEFSPLPDRTGRTAVYIHMDRLLHNLRAMRAVLPEQTGLVAVLKTNAYGHGAEAIARVLEEETGIWGYALATAEEAIALRDAGMQKPMLILGYTWKDAYEALIERDIRMAVFRPDTLEQLSAAAAGKGKAARVHIKVDTGMSRIGITPDEAGVRYVKQACETAGVEVEGIFTHFARADERDPQSAREQASRFEAFLGRLREERIDIPLSHCDNSAGMLLVPHGKMALARAGITMYGLWPSAEVPRERIALKPVLEWKSRVVFVKDIPAGTEVSYGGIWKAPVPSRIATIAVGYGDGYPRSLSGRGEVLIRGRRVPIVGRVCMDQLMADVTALPQVREDDVVTLIGRDGAEEITAEEIGDRSGRFNYELVCDINPRVPRVPVRARTD